MAWIFLRPSCPFCTGGISARDAAARRASRPATVPPLGLRRWAPDRIRDAGINVTGRPTYWRRVDTRGRLGVDDGAV